MNRLLIKYLLLFTLFLSMGWSQEKIAIIPFEGIGVDNNTATIITNRFSSELSTSGRYDIIEREMMNKILEEQEFQSSGCVTDTCIVEIGQLIGVRQIVAGNVSKIEDLYSLNIRLIDVATGTITYQKTSDFEGSIKDFLQIAVKNSALTMAAETTIIPEIGDTGSNTYSSTKTGEVIFNIDQTNVAIFIDGRYSSLSTGNKVSFKLSEGTHKIKFSLSGYHDWEKEISVISGEQLVYDVTMKTGLSSGRETENETGILLVHSEPLGANVFVDGVNKGITVLQLTDIGAGAHEIRVEKNLYYTYTEIVEVSTDGIIEVQAQLKPRFGKLSITSVPENCVVKINDQVKGKTPYTADQIESGSYKITVSKDLYHTHEENFIITDGSNNPRQIALTPAFGKLQVTTAPAGAEVKIDGQSRGKTPFVLDELPSGNYNLSVSLDMYQTVDRQVLIEDGKTNDIFLTMDARFALLTVTGSPTGAEIRMKGELIGNIPLKNYRLQEGMWPMDVSAENYHTQTDFLNVKRDQPISQKIALKRHTGKLIVITEPPGAEVYLDESSVGKSPKILDEIPTGSHSVLVNHPDFLKDSKDFKLVLDEKKELRFKLITYSGSIQQQIDDTRSKRKKYLYITLATAAIGYYMSYSAEKSYDQYVSATSTSSAKDYYNKTAMQDKISVGGYGAAIALTPIILKMSFDIGKLEKKITRN